MKAKLITAGLMLCSCLMPLPASASSFSHIYAFGNSVTDDGNTYEYTNGTIPSALYFQGRFSNGLVWTEYLANSLKVETTNYAVLGATTGNENVFITDPPIALPGLTQQIQGFLTANQQADSQALYIIWAGADDYVSGVRDANQPVGNLISAVESLAQKGAKNFLIPNLPDLGIFPQMKASMDVDELTAISDVHNIRLNQAVAGLNQQRPELKITVLDIDSLVNQIFASPGDFGYINVTDTCLNLTTSSICSQPNQYFLWDDVHPTTYTHKIIAGAALKAVPESYGVLGILGIGALGVTGMVKRQRQKISDYSNKSSS